MTDARVTQTSVEEWADGNPAARATQVGVEVWGAISAATRAAVVSQVAVEEWAVIAAPPVVVNNYNTAVSINV